MILITTGIIVFGSSLFTFDWLDKLSGIILFFECVSFIFGFAVAIYTGILIQSVKYVPFWNTWFLPGLFTVSALSTGSMAIILSVLGYDIITASQQSSRQIIDTVMHIEQVLILIEAIVLGLYLYLRHQAGDQGMNSVRLLLSGRLKFVFWGGIITSGFLLPVILEFIYSGMHDYPVIMIIAGMFLLTGGYFLRAGIIYAGIKELHPLQNMYELDYTQDVMKKNKE
jgi:polysulfide reductase chain C